MSVHDVPLNEQDWNEVYDLAAALDAYAEPEAEFDEGEGDFID